MIIKFNIIIEISISIDLRNITIIILFLLYCYSYYNYYHITIIIISILLLLVLDFYYYYLPSSYQYITITNASILHGWETLFLSIVLEPNYYNLDQTDGRIVKNNIIESNLMNILTALFNQRGFVLFHFS